MKLYQITEDKLKEWLNNLDYYKVSHVVDDINNLMSSTTDSLSLHSQNYLYVGAVFKLFNHNSNFNGQVLQIIEINGEEILACLVEEDNPTDFIKVHVLKVTPNNLLPLSYAKATRHNYDGYYMVIPTNITSYNVPDDCTHIVRNVNHCLKYVCKIKSVHEVDSFEYAECVIYTHQSSYYQNITYLPLDSLAKVSFPKAELLGFKAPPSNFKV